MIQEALRLCAGGPHCLRGSGSPLFFMPARGLYVDFRTDFPLNPAVEGLVLRNTVSDQNKNMAIDRAALIISYISNFLEHFFLYADRYTLHAHKQQPLADGIFNMDSAGLSMLQAGQGPLTPRGSCSPPAA